MRVVSTNREGEKDRGERIEVKSERVSGLVCPVNVCVCVCVCVCLYACVEYLSSINEKTVVNAVSSIPNKISLKLVRKVKRISRSRCESYSCHKAIKVPQSGIRGNRRHSAGWEARHRIPKAELAFRGGIIVEGIATNMNVSGEGDTRARAHTHTHTHTHTHIHEREILRERERESVCVCVCVCEIEKREHLKS